MEEQQILAQQNSANKYKLLIFFVIILSSFFICLFVYLNFFRDTDLGLGTNTASKKSFDQAAVNSTSSSFATLRDLDQLKDVNEQYKTGKYAQAQAGLEKVLEEYDFKNNQRLEETAILYKLVTQLKTERDAALQGHYDFYKDASKSNINRAYALLMASQDVRAHNDPQKLLAVLNEEEIKKLTSTTDSAEIYYLINKKIFELYPFPIAATRMAYFELRDIKDPDTAKDIFQQYTFGIEEHLENMLKNPGLSHLVPLSYANLAILQSRMEDFGVVNQVSTTSLFEKSYNYSKIYTGHPSPQFILFSIMDYQAKIGKVENVKKLLSSFTYKGNTNPNSEELDKLVKRQFVGEKTFSSSYPKLFELYKKDPELKLLMDKVVK